MEIKDLGEDGLIQHIKKAAGMENERVIAGIGDDAAVIKKKGGGCLLAALDMLIEDIHFTANTPFFDIGHKAIGVNLSDIAAMGGTPEYAFTSIGVRDGMSVEDIGRLYEGLLSHAGEYGVSLLGGDTNRSPRGFVIDICVLGQVGEKDLCLRSGARAGDSIFVTGALGKSALALKKSLYAPVTPRVKEAKALLEITKPSSMIDISDGLAKDLRRLCESSGTGAEISREKIPAAEGASFEEAFSAGEDFELLFTAPASENAKLLSSFSLKTGIQLSLIGKMTEGNLGIFIRDKNNKKTPLEGGYDHFTR
jgi:thiamine-monophosphate kinase